MKTNLTKLITLCLMLFMSYGAFAQDQTKNVNDVYTYTVVPDADAVGTTSTYLWTISGVKDTDWKILSGSLTSLSVEIQWLKPANPAVPADMYDMTFTESETTNGTTCSTTESGQILVVNNFDVVIADAAADQCGTGTDGTTDFTFTVTKTGGADNWSFNYLTTGLTPNISNPTLISVVGKNSIDITISVPNVDTGLDQTFSVAINTVTDAFGNEDKTLTSTADVTLYGVPNTGTINW